MLPIRTSFHHIREGLQLTHPLLMQAGLGDTLPSHLAVPVHIDPQQHSILLRDIARIPDEMLDSVEAIPAHAVDDGQGAVDLSLPRLLHWLSGASGYWVAYGQGYIRLTKLTESGHGPCVKQQVVATLVTPEGQVFSGTNRCRTPQSVCPRDTLGMRSGEGYHLCHTVCNQVAHAEVDAIQQAGELAKGALIYLTGHTYACDNCQREAHTCAAHIQVSPRLK